MIKRVTGRTVGRWRDEQTVSNWQGRREKKIKQSSKCVSGGGRHDGERL